MSLNILIFSRDPAWFGGVVNFIELLKENLCDEFTVDHFLVGQRKNASGKFLQLFVPIVDGLRLMFKLIFSRYAVYHLNPSLNSISLVRDGLFLALIKVFGSGKTLISFHGWDNATAERIGSSKVRRYFFLKLFGTADNIVVLAEPFKKWLVKTGISKDRISLYTTMFDGRNISRRDVSNFDSLNINILFLSRLVSEKGVFELLAAFKCLSLTYPEIKLKVAGTGPAEEDMKKWVVDNDLSGKIEFLGYVRGEDKAGVLCSADIFAFPTYYGEGCPVSLLEAMAAGQAVVTTSVGGIPHIIENGKNGFLIEGEVTKLSVASALEKLLSDKDKLLEIGLHNQEEAWEKYEAPVVTKIFESFYRI
jgi:glycosyltransferase involved in cell wall biosynthesis